MPSQAVLELLVELKDQASSGLDSLGGALKTVGGIAGGVALAGVAAFGAAVVSGVGDAREANQIMAQTQAVIKSTGGAAGFTAEQIADMAGQLSAASGQSLFGDSDIQKGQNLLLTFTNITETLPDATKTMVDMAQALGTDVSGGAIQLGKALNDPIAGISALSRVGVTFTEEQKAQIKAMQDAGNVAGAQKVILAELNKEFGGSAQAAADADGGWAQFNDRLGEAKETLGAAVLPILTTVVGFLNDSLMPAVEAGAAAFAAWLSDPAVQAGIQQIGDAITTGLGVAFDFIANTAIPALLSAWAFIQPALQIAGDFIVNTIIPAIGTLASWLGEQLPGAIAILTEYWTSTLLPIFNALVDLWTTSLQPALSDLAGWLGENLPPLLAALADLWTGTLQPAIAVVAQFIAEQLIPKIGELVNWLRENLPPAIKTVSDFWTNTLLPAINAVWGFISETLIPTIQNLAGSVFGTLNQKTEEVSGFWTGTLKPALDAVWSFLSTYIIPIFTALASVAIALVKKEIELLSALWTGVLQPALKAVWEFIDANIVPIFKALVDTYIADLKTSLQAMSDLWTGTLQPALEAVVKVIGDTLSPALAGVKTSLGYISDAVKGVIDFFGDLAEAIDKIEIPSWLKGASPPPLANWLGYIGEAAQGVAKTALPALQTALTQLVPVGRLAATGAIEGFANEWPAMESTIQSFGDKMIAKAADVAKSAQQALSSAFGATATIDRQMAANLDKLADVHRQFDRDYIAQSLETIQKTAQAYADPKVGAQYFKMMSDQLFETQKIRDQITEATSEDEKKRLEEQLILISRAQEAELSAFHAAQQGATSPLQTIADQIRGLLGSLPGTNQTDAQITLADALQTLIDQLTSAQHRALGGPVAAGQGYWVGERGPEYFRPGTSGAIVPNGAGGVVFNNTFNLPPGTTQQLVDMVMARMNQQMKGRR